MALTNAEKQAAWRARRDQYVRDLEVQYFKNESELDRQDQHIKKLKAEVKKLDAEVNNPERIDQYWANAAALLHDLITEGKKDQATFSPNTVRRFAALLKRQLDALYNGNELPELPPAERNLASVSGRLMSVPSVGYVTGPTAECQTERPEVAAQVPSAGSLGLFFEVDSGSHLGRTSFPERKSFPPGRTFCPLGTT